MTETENKQTENSIPKNNFMMLKKTVNEMICNIGIVYEIILKNA